MGVGIEPIDGDEKEQRSETRSKRWSRGESCCSPPDGLEKERCDAVHLPDPFNCCRDWLRGPLIPIGSSAPPDPNLAIRNFEKSFTWRNTAQVRLPSSTPSATPTLPVDFLLPSPRRIASRPAQPSQCCRTLSGPPAPCPSPLADGGPSFSRMPPSSPTLSHGRPRFH